MSDLLKSKIRSVGDKDRETLSKYSYSGLSTLKHCPYQFNLTYNEGKRSSDTSLALQLGTLLHYILEQKGRMLKEKNKVDYGILSDILQNGTDVTDDKTQESIAGLKELKRDYWEIWGVPDSEGRTYNEKIELFLRVLSKEMENSDWQPYLFEHPFEFVYDDKIILHGFIDRVDRKTITGKEIAGEFYRVIDYKTNKKPYPDKDLKTSLQFGIYALAMLNEFGVVPKEYQYRLILLDQEQKALSFGWGKRLIAALDGLVSDLENRKRSGEWTPKPTPLCHWCNFCATNGDAKQYRNECPFYSLWTPENKTFEVNMKYENSTLDGLQNNKTIINNALDKKDRRVIF